MWTALKIRCERIFNCDLELDEWSNPYAKNISSLMTKHAYMYIYVQARLSLEVINSIGSKIL